jgi:hypothetical protein
MPEGDKRRESGRTVQPSEEISMHRRCTRMSDGTNGGGGRCVYYADVYPIFVRGDLAREDGAALGEAMTSATFQGRPAIQVSRRSNHLVATVDTAAIKFQKVLEWLTSR